MLIVKFALKAINIIFAILLALAFLSWRFSAESIPYISTFSLAVPMLMVINLIFVIGWAVKLDLFFLYSTFALLVGIGQWEHFFAVGAASAPDTVADIKVMSYNVRTFNSERWSQEKNIPEKVQELIYEQDPDVICFQEYSPSKINLSKWKYKYIVGFDAIFSKYPILKTFSFDFKNSYNNAIYADISLPKGKIVRVYSLHLQSLSIRPEEVNNIHKIGSTEQVKSQVKGLIKRLDHGFSIQQSQTALLRQNMDTCPHPKITAGDFNNTPFSRTFHTVLGGDMYDTFSEGSWGFGRTFHLINLYPLRIDFIMAQEDTFSTNSFQVINKKLSDHYPIVSSLSFIEQTES